MTGVLVDSNVLLDIMGEDERWSTWSASRLAEVIDTSRAIINPVIYAEVSVRFSRIEEVEDALSRSVLQRESIPYEAAFLAGKIFARYRQRGGRKLSPLPDFFIGAHAAVAGYRLLTRDPRRYRSVFRDLDLIAPA